MKLRVISFYTNGLYERLSQCLVRSCATFGLDVVVQHRADMGSWARNSGQKPKFILEMLESHKCDLLWVDADAEFVSCPGSLDHLDCDFGAHRTLRRYIGGTLLVRNRKATKVMLMEWIAEHERRLEVPCDKVMQVALEKCSLEIGQLDPEYVYVFDVWKIRYPDCKPVILHKQASRIRGALLRSFKPDRRSKTAVHPEVRRFDRELRG